MSIPSAHPVSLFPQDTYADAKHRSWLGQTQLYQPWAGEMHACTSGLDGRDIGRTGFGPGLRGWRHPVSIPSALPVSFFPHDTYADTKHRSWLGQTQLYQPWAREMHACTGGLDGRDIGRTGFGPGLRGWRHPVSIPSAHPVSLFPQDTYADTKHRSWLGQPQLYQPWAREMHACTGGLDGRDIGRTGFGPGLRGWRHPVSIPSALPVSFIPQHTYAYTKHRSWLGQP